MRYSNFNLKQKKTLSINSTKDYPKIEKELYQQFLRNQNIEPKHISPSNFENIFTNEIYFRAMKSLPIIEKTFFYLYFYNNRNLSQICKILKKSKFEIIKLKSRSIYHFKRNTAYYQKLYTKKNGCDVNE